ncbi:flagellin [Clostridium sp. JS66]|uniref:flagellin N-terminal helical domain-containing protein n=1 Tax=Clostridium sp. JS66 TaxID=3064705 RepID=UPI00298E42CD|nr:flagellin [Clostridium sp. JS66]WPC41019.1 flagellin [Clostridium sp. JS66]
MQIQSYSTSYYNQSIANMQKAMLRISTASKLNSAADNAANLAISESLQSQSRGLDQAVRNTQDSISLLDTAEGSMGNSSDVLQRMRELSVQASNGTLTDEDRSNIQQEMDQLKDQLDSNAKNTQFNGIYTNNGTLSNFTTQTGANNKENLSMSIGNVSSSALGVNANVSTQSAASDSLKSIDDAINKLSSSRGEIGAVTNNLSYSMDNASQTSLNYQSANSNYKDADIAKEISLFNQSNIGLYSNIMALSSGIQQQNFISTLV